MSDKIDGIRNKMNMLKKKRLKVGAQTGPIRE